MATTSRKDLPGTNAPNWSQRVTEELRVLMGRGGNGRALTAKDLIDSGIAKPGAGGGLVPGVPGGGDIEPDLTPPPVPTGFAVTAGLTTVFVEHDAPGYTQGHGHDRTVVYGVLQTGSTAPTFDQAVVLFQFQGTIGAYPAALGTRYRLWIKWQSQDGVQSVSPAGGTNGLDVQTGKIGNNDLGPLIVEAGNLANGSVSASKLAAQAVDATKFANGIEPVSVSTAATLPTVKSTSTIVWQGKLYRWDGSKYTAAVPTVDLTGTIIASQIAAGAVDVTKFASGIEPVTNSAAASLPTVKTTTVITWQGKLYRWDGSKYTAEVAVVDLAGQIDAAKLADNAVTVSKIAAGAVEAGKLAAGAVTADKIAAAAVDATKFASGIEPVTNSAAASLPTVKSTTVITWQGKLYRWDGSKYSAEVAAVDLTGQIDSTKLADNAVTVSKIAAGAVDAGKLASGAVTTDKIAAAAVDVTKFASGIEPVTNSAAGSLPTVKSTTVITWQGKLYRWDGTKYTAEVAAVDLTGQIDSAKLADNAVTVSKIAAGAVDAGKLASGAVTTDKIAAAAVDTTKFASGIEPVTNSTAGTLPTVKSTTTITWQGKLYRWDGSKYTATVPTADLTGTIVASQIAAGAVDTTKFASGIEPVSNSTAGSLPTVKSTTVITWQGKLYRWDGAKYSAEVAVGDMVGQISATQIADNAITTPKLAANSVDAGKIAANAVTANAVSADAITAGKIAAGAVNTRELAANSVTANKLVITSTDAVNLDPFFQDASIWEGPNWTRKAGSVGSPGPYVMSSLINQSFMAPGSKTPVDPAKTYLLETWFKASAVGTPKSFAMLRFYDVDGNALINADAPNVGWPSSNTAQGNYYFPDTANVPQTTWTRHTLTVGPNGTGKFPAKAAYFTVGAFLNYSGAAPVYEAQWGGFRMTEMARGELIVDGAVTANAIAAGAVTAGKIAANAVTANEIAANAITTAKIAAGAVTTTELAAGSVTASKMVLADTSNAYPDFDVQDDAGYSSTSAFTFSGASSSYGGRRVVWIQAPAAASSDATVWTYAEMGFQVEANSQYLVSMQTARQAASAATLQILSKLGVKTGNLAVTWDAEVLQNSDAAASTAAYKTFVVSTNNRTRMQLGFRLLAGAATGGYFGSITVRKMNGGSLIVDGAITAAKIAANTITAAEIAAGTITATELAAGSITTGKIAAGAITATELATNAVTAVKIAAGAVTAGKIAANAVTANEIAANSITTAKIAAGAVTATEIAAGAVTASKMVITDPSTLVPDADYSDIAMWTAGQGGTISIVTTTNREYNTLENRALQLNRVQTGTDWDAAYSAKFAFRENTGYRFRTTVYVPAAATFKVRLMTHDSAGNTGAYKDADVVATGSGWYSVEETFTSPANAAAARAYIYIHETSTAAYLRMGKFYVQERTTASLIVDGAITAEKIAVKAITAAQIAAGTITGAEIAANTITAAKIAVGTITATELATNAVTAVKIAAGAVTAGKIAANAVTANEIAANAITTAKIAAGAVTTAELAAGSVTANKLVITSTDTVNVDPFFQDADLWAAAGVTRKSVEGSPGPFVLSAVTSVSIAPVGTRTPIDTSKTYLFETWYYAAGETVNRAFTTVRFYDVNGVELKNADTPINGWPSNNAPSGNYYFPAINTPTVNAWTRYTLTVGPEGVAKFPAKAAYFITGTFLNYSGAAPLVESMWGGMRVVEMSRGELIVDGAITAAKIAAKTITAAEIAAGSITSTELGANSVTAGKIAAGTVTANELATNSVTAVKIAAGAVTAGKIAANAVTANEIAANAITTAKIAAGAVSATELAAGSVLASKLVVSDTSTMVPDSEYQDIDMWFGDSGGTVAFRLNEPNALAGTVSKSVLQINRLTTGTTAYDGGRSSRFAVTPNTDYVLRVNVYSPGASSVKIRVVTLTPADVSRSTDLDVTYASGSWGIHELKVRTSATESRAQVYIYIREDSTAAYLYVGKMRFQEAAAGALIVDGAIIAAKLATGSVTANAIAANSVTTNAIAANAVTANEIAANAVTTAKIAAGAVSADQIAANAITVKHLTVMDYSNIVLDPFIADNSSWATFTGTMVTRATAGVPANMPGPSGVQLSKSAAQSVLSRNFQTSPGEVYYMSAYVASATTTGLSIRLMLQLIDGTGTEGGNNGTHVGWVAAVTTTAASVTANTWTKIEGLVTVPAGAAFGKARIVTETGTAATGNWFATNFVCRRAASAELIVDGAITATKIAAGAIAVGTAAIQNGAIVNAMIGNLSADKINAGTLNAARIAAGTITSSHLSANSVIAGKIAANAVTAGTIAANAVTANQIAAGAITVDKLAAGSITAEKLSVGIGGNLCPDPMFTPGLAFWQYTISHSQYGNGARGVNMNFDYTVPGTPTLFLEDLTLYGQGQPLGTYRKGFVSAPISVIAGERYEASVYAAFHRCHGEMYLEFFDANGTWVGGGGFGVITDQPSGGRSLANFRRTGGFVTAPAGAITARITILSGAQMAGTSWSNYMFLARPFVGRASALQTELSPWSPSSNTSILPDGITTPSISALAGKFGDIEIRPTAGASGCIRVYDANGTLRVRLGIW